MQRKHNKDIVPTAKMLRKNMTTEEKHLRYDFLRTYPVEGWVTSLKEYLLSDGRVSVTALKRVFLIFEYTSKPIEKSVKICYNDPTDKRKTQELCAVVPA